MTIKRAVAGFETAERNGRLLTSSAKANSPTGFQPEDVE